MNLSTVRAFGHYIDQPATIAMARKGAMGVAAAAGLGLFMRDTLQGETFTEKRKNALRSGLVLGATTLGTILATRKWMPIKAEVHTIGEDVIQRFKQRYSPRIMDLIEKKRQQLPLSLAEFQELLGGMKKDVLAKYPNKAEAMRILEKDIAEALPVGHTHHGFMDSMKHSFDEMKDFFRVGLASVVSGFVGGAVANKLNNEPAGKNLPMMKEGLFQILANIVVCTIGAGLGLAAINTPVIKNKLQPLGLPGKLAKVGIVATGLFSGIGLGGAAANHIGNKWLGPSFNHHGPKHQDKRRMEFADVILHFDDIATGMVLAGVEALKPFLPLFFAFSGYRTGMGYRNGKNGRNEKSGKEEQPTPVSSLTHPAHPVASLPANPFVTQPTLLNNNNAVFQSFYYRRM